MSAPAVPERGDAVWLDFDPQAGHEQAHRRPALVLSPAEFNRVTGFAFFCPITSKPKGYPFEVAIPSGLKAKGVVLVDQTRSLDWRARKWAFICKLPPEVLAEAIGKIEAVLYPE